MTYLISLLVSALLFCFFGHQLLTISSSSRRHQHWLWHRLPDKQVDSLLETLSLLAGVSLLVSFIALVLGVVSLLTQM